MEFSAQMIAEFLGGEVIGNPDVKVTNVAKIEEGRAGDLSFLSNLKYEEHLYNSDASIVIVDRDFQPSKEVKTTLVKVDDAYAAFAKLLELYAANKPQKKGVSEKASISEKAEIGKECYIGAFAVIEDGAKIGNGAKIYPNVYVGDGVKIGKNTIIYANVSLNEDCVIGDNVIIHSGAVIGADGFGFAPDTDGVYAKIPQIGNVIIEDNVEIGANTTIDRATMGSTVIKKGVKLDNLIQIAHNVVVGENTVAASQVGVAGSTKLGKNMVIGGQVGIVGHLTIGDRVQIASQSGVSHNVEEGEILMGSPTMKMSAYRRVNVVFRQLPELSAKVRSLEKQLEKIAEKQCEK